ncbi:MAG: ArsR/SmtB family transcription factor [Rhabdochlamydiaceae bacterium]
MLLVDPMRRTILNLLADTAYTESQIADIVGLADASVGHHLRILAKSKLIKLVKREEEAHGIMQNFYRAVALCIAVDIERMSKSVSKYFFPVNIERIRGTMAGLKIGKNEGFPSTGTADLERIAERLAVFIAREATRLGIRETSFDRETITIQIYSRALRKALREPPDAEVEFK